MAISLTKVELMNKIFKIISIALALVSTQAFADAKQDLQNELKKYDALSANFSQNVVKKDGALISKTQGTLALKKPDSLMLHTLSPDEQVLFTKGQDVYFYDPFVNQVTIFDKKDLYSSPFLLLTSNSTKIWQQYEVSRNGNSYTLEPKVKGDVFSIAVKLNSGNICQLSITMKDGNINTYDLASVKYSVSAQAFDYDIPKDAQVDDERRSN